MKIERFTLNGAVVRRIEELMSEKGITQYALARLSGVSQSSLSEIRSGGNRFISVNHIYSIACALGTDLAEFFSAPYFKDVND